MLSEEMNPSYHIRELMKERGWTSIDLVVSMQRPIQEINEIVAGYREITFDVAAGLAKAFDTTLQYWLNRQLSYEMAETAAED